MKSIANQEFTVTVQFNNEEKEYNVLSIDIYEEFEIDKYFNRIVKAFQKEEGQPIKGAFDFIVETLGSVDDVVKFAELGKKIIAEFNDAPLFEVASKFPDVILALQVYRQNLKKK